MIDKIRALYAKYGDILRYAVVGGITTLLDIGVFTLLNVTFGMHYQFANVIAWIVAVAFAFVGNKWIVFRSNTTKRETLIKEGASFVVMRLLTLGFSTLFLYVTVGLLHWNEPLAKFISTVVVIILNYVLSKLFVFKKPQ